MKICNIANGSSIHIQRWVNYFAGKGHEISLISSTFLDGYDERVRLYQLARLMPQAWPVTRYPSALLWPVQFRRLLDCIKPDILHAHNVTVFGYMAAVSGFHPLVMSPMGSDILILAKRNPVHRVLTKASLRKADIIVHDSQIMGQELLRLGATSDKMRLVYLGVDTEQFSPRQRTDSAENGVYVTGTPTVISIRNFWPVYNVEMLIRAVPLVLKQVKAKFIVAGEGGQKNYLKELAESLGVLDSIRFVGFIPHDDLSRHFCSADVYVSTSLSDSSSLSLQEAMACELPPVVTDAPSNREWVTDGQNGFIVPVNDIQQLANRIVYLLTNREIRRKFGEAGRKVIVARADHVKEMERMEAIYRGLTK